jgi:hypothetical protein
MFAQVRESASLIEAWIGQAVDVATGKAPNLVSTWDARRSTRICQIVPVTISSRTGDGNSFLESTSTLAMNCHGCLYPSQNEYRPGSWVNLEVQAPQADGKPHPVRAQVRFIRPSQNPGEPYHVGIELQTPANVWGIPVPPEDWLRFPGAASAATAASALAPALHSDVTAPTEQKIHVLSESLGINPETLSSLPAEIVQRPSDNSPGWDNPMRVAPDEVRLAFDAKLLQAAEKAFSLAVTSHINTAITQAVKTIETFSQATVRDAEQHCLVYREKLFASARGQLEASLAQAQETAQRLENGSTEVHIILAEALTFLKETAQELGKQFSTSIQESADRAAVNFGDKTAQFSDRHLAHLVEQVQATTGESMTRLDRRASEANAQLDTLNLLAAKIRTEGEAQRQAFRDELARTREQAVQQFRQRMEELWNSSLVAALSVLHEHSRSVLDALSKEPTHTIAGNLS